MSESAELQHVMAIPLLRGLPEDAREQVARVILDIAERWDLADGETLMEEGHLAFDSGYVLIEGGVDIERKGRNATTLTAPALLGEMSQFKFSDTRTASVRAKGDASVLQFQWEDFYERAREALSEGGYSALMDAIERLVWDRFGGQPLLDLPLFRGLEAELRLKVCIVFPWIADAARFADGQTIFETGARCQSKGHLLMAGTVKLVGSDRSEKTVSAPHLIGVMPKHEPALEWTATAIAKGAVELLTFSWQQYIARLQKRLTADEQRRLIEAMKSNAAAHFWH
ncbi:MAG TPA: cyclic nucleotide-binding domain-containing protein [Candidatus Hydrogenedentes bacterium]|nr:cyclic nucleotide-binding domain-containing protein [Candidatus Hydrogenedentota bacterium]HNT88382.1 cyclic nucleotide-binding domain-containing protein [Candidatus Hydrogenedentota bacterium]